MFYQLFQSRFAKHKPQRMFLMSVLKTGSIELHVADKLPIPHRLFKWIGFTGFRRDCPSSVLRIYESLIHLADDSTVRFAPEFEASHKTIQDLSGVGCRDRRTASFNALQQMGLIDFVSGGGNQSNRFTIKADVLDRLPKGVSDHDLKTAIADYRVRTQKGKSKAKKDTPLGGKKTPTLGGKTPPALGGKKTRGSEKTLYYNSLKSLRSLNNTTPPAVGSGVSDDDDSEQAEKLPEPILPSGSTSEIAVRRPECDAAVLEPELQASVAPENPRPAEGQSGVNGNSGSTIAPGGALEVIFEAHPAKASDGDPRRRKVARIIKGFNASIPLVMDRHHLTDEAAELFLQERHAAYIGSFKGRSYPVHLYYFFERKMFFDSPRKWEQYGNHDSNSRKPQRPAGPVVDCLNGIVVSR